MEKLTLRGLVLNKFSSISAFAREANWSRHKASNIVNGFQRPNADEMETLASILGVTDVSLFMSLFFPSLSTM